MTEYVGLDFETYSDVDIRKHGLDRYTSSKFFQPLLACAKLNTMAFGDNWSHYILYDNQQSQISNLRDLVTGRTVVAYNAAFEYACLKFYGLEDAPEAYIDAATVARQYGLSPSLGRSAPQLLDTGKLDSGLALIKLFSIPGKYQEWNQSNVFDPRIIYDNLPEWEEFKEYCHIDAELGLKIATASNVDLAQTSGSWAIEDMFTRSMNRLGWPVDLDLVHRMKHQYEVNKAAALEEFQKVHDPDGLLNFNSSKQLYEWCKERGLNAKSFNEKNVAYMLKRLEKKIEILSQKVPAIPALAKQLEGFLAVEAALKTKQTLGGSALYKLDKILDTVGEDGRLRNQYIYFGAVQTGRTTGVGVQMQNLKRLGSDIADVSDVSDWDNNKLAENLRQVFTSSHPDGQLIVGDFSSVEARGLAYIAGEKWVLDSFAKDLDLYKVAASKQYNVDYSDVTPEQRQFGKVGELSCGYGAGRDAVKDFAEKMGTVLTPIEAGTIVNNWRAARPKTVQLWNDLDDLLWSHMRDPGSTQTLRTGLREEPVTIRVSSKPALASIEEIKRGTRDVTVQLTWETGTLTRVFRGMYVFFNKLVYHKPVSATTKALWQDWFVDSEGNRQKNTIWGGKLAGILTQSFCRELFMEAYRMLIPITVSDSNISVIGQFHDELVMDWVPGKASLESAVSILRTCMNAVGPIQLPINSSIKHDYRYVK